MTAPVGAGVLSAVLSELSRRGALAGPTLTDVLADRSFVLARLDDGRLGTAMNYAVWPSYDADLFARARTEAAALHRATADDPVLERTLLRVPAGDLTLTQQAARVAILSALSMPFLEEANLAEHSFRSVRVNYEAHHYLQDPMASALMHEVLGSDATVGIVGFGGLMEVLARLETVREIRIIDRHLAHRLDMVTRVLENLNRRAGSPRVRVVGSDLDALADCDVVSVTASTLCNGTLDGILKALRSKRLIVQGPSGALLPDPFFNGGVALLCIETKRPAYLDAYRYDDRAYEWYVEFDDRLYIAPERAGS